MADAVGSQVILDGPRHTIMKFTNVSDGTGESAVLKVDVSSLTGAPASVSIDRIHFSTAGMSVRIAWDATADVDAFVLGPDQVGSLCFVGFGGIHNNAGAGVTGDIVFTTIGAASGDSYSTVLELRKF